MSRLSGTGKAPNHLLRWLSLGIGVLLIVPLGEGLRAAGPDTAVYPVSGRAPGDAAAPPLLFETLQETAFPGLPTATPLEAGPDGASATVHTSAGAFPVAAPPPEPHGAAGAGATPSAVLGESGGRPCWLAGSAPRWFSRLRPIASPEACLEGPRGVVAVLSPDGTIYGRKRSNGHLLWRRLASHRTSRPGAALGPYLLVAADASRRLEAFRWSDGSPAGLFLLDSEDASFASTPIVAGGRIFVLAIQMPRAQTRLLILRPLPDAAPGKEKGEARPRPSQSMLRRIGSSRGFPPPLPGAVGSESPSSAARRR